MKNKDVYTHPRTGAHVVIAAFTYLDDNGEKVRVSNIRVDSPLNVGVRKGLRKLGYKRVLEVTSYRYLTNREVTQTTVLRTERAVADYAQESLRKRNPNTVSGADFASSAVSARRYSRAKQRQMSLTPGQMTKGQVDAMARAAIRSGLA
ncbi:hypothetical protein [Nocardia sp. NPDC050435]|uniref:hypothetical protein n=1 Tax=Nocardia sp. NPDC050435 TaxID=3155040 RepID=UPI0033F7A9B8